MDWLKELRDKARSNGDAKSIADLKKTIEKNNQLAIKERNRFSLFRDENYIKKLEKSSEDLQKIIDDIEAPLKKQQEYIYQLEKAADERRELRSKVYKMMMNTVQNRREVFTKLTSGILPDGQLETIHGDQAAYNWLDEHPEHGSSTSYRRMNMLSSALATVRSHNKIEQMMRAIDNAKKAREDIEKDINANIDVLYTQKKSYTEICEWLPEKERLLEETGKGIEAKRAALLRLQKQYAEIATRYNKDLEKYDNTELKQNIKDLEADAEDCIQRVPSMALEVVETDKHIKTLTKSLNEVKEYLPLEENKRSIQEELAKVNKGTSIIIQYNEIPMDFLKAEKDKNGVDKDAIGLTEPGKQLYRPIGLLRSYVLVKKQIMDEYLKLTRDTIANGGRINAKSFVTCRDKCYALYSSLDKAFNSKPKSFMEEFDQDAYAKLYSAKVAEMFPKDSDKKYAPLDANKAFSDYETTEPSLINLKNAKKGSELRTFLKDLHDKSEMFANHLRVECALIKEQQTAERVNDCNEMLQSVGQKTIKKFDSWFTWDSTKEKLEKEVVALGKLMNLSAADKEEKADLLEIYDNVEKQNKSLDYLDANFDSLLTDKETLDKQRNELNLQMKDADAKIDSFNKNYPDTAKLLQTRGSKNLMKQIPEAIEDKKKDKEIALKALETIKKRPEKIKQEIEKLQQKISENDENRKISEDNRRKEEIEFKLNHPEMDNLDNELKPLDREYTEKALEVEGYRGIIKKEIPEMFGKFVRLKNQVQRMGTRVQNLLGEQTNIEDLWVKEENRYDLDKNRFYSGDFRKNTIQDLTVFFENARTTTRIFKKEDSAEYLAMMNAIADAVGQPKLRREWGPVDHQHEDFVEAEKLSLNSGDLRSCLTKLDKIVETANEYIRAKGTQTRPIESDMRKKRLGAARSIIARAQLAINQLKGFPKDGETTGKDGLIDEVDKMNNAYNSVVRSFGAAENGKTKNPFKLYEDAQKKYRLDKDEDQKFVRIDEKDPDKGYRLITSNEQADYDAFFDACINPAAEQLKAKHANSIVGLPKNSHLYPEISAKEISKDKTVEVTKKQEGLNKGIQEEKNVEAKTGEKKGLLSYHK